jgi:hypothetical protein
LWEIDAEEPLCEWRVLREEVPTVVAAGGKGGGGGAERERKVSPRITGLTIGRHVGGRREGGREGG